MRAVKLVTAGVLEVRDVPLPAFAPDEVLVQVAGAGLCQSDLHVLHLPNWPVQDLTLGHETAGRIAQIGGDVRGFAHGDPVLVHLVWACGLCRQCAEGRDNVCARAGRAGLPPCPGLGPDGGMAEYIAVKARYLEALGDLDPITAAPLADAGLTSMHAINGARHRLGPGSTAVVIGVGGLGHLGVQILKATSDARIIAVDSDPAKIEIASALGADVALASDADSLHRLLALTDGYGADAVFDFVGAQPTVDLAVQVIAPDGALRLVGLGGARLTQVADGRTVPLPFGVDVRRSYGGTRQDLRRVIGLAQSGQVTAHVQQYRLDDALRAFDDLAAGRVLGRAVLVP